MTLAYQSKCIRDPSVRLVSIKKYLRAKAVFKHAISTLAGLVENTVKNTEEWPFSISDRCQLYKCSLRFYSDVTRHAYAIIGTCCMTGSREGDGGTVVTWKVIILRKKTFLFIYRLYQ